jgi:chemotaxis protein MotB
MSAPATPPIIIIKKKGGHGGHHGGAWKVAYADFVTAMMALFIVLWLLSSSNEVQKAVAGYFRDPKGVGKQTGSSMGGNGEALTITKSNMSLLKSTLERAISKNPELKKIKDYVQMTVTDEGLRIELLESEKGMFFDNGQATPTDAGKELLTRLAQQLGSMQNPILIEGHTDAKPFDNPNYSNWELSADRANAARRIMQETGLRASQITQVRGFADQQLRLPADPEAPSNRRVSILVLYPRAAAGPADAKESGKETSAEKGGEGEAKGGEEHGSSEAGAKPAPEKHEAAAKPAAEKH